MTPTEARVFVRGDASGLIEPAVHEGGGRLVALEEANVLVWANGDARELKAVLLTIPNMTHPDAPVSIDPAGNKVITTWGQPRKFDFKALDHVALAEALDLVDFEAGASVTGQKFYFLKNEAALLELALVQYAMQALVREGYTPVVTPERTTTES